MTSLDDDWVCDDDQLDGNCFAVWQFCEDCASTPVDLDFPYHGGFVLAGQGYPIDDMYGNLWYEERDILRGKYDICVSCTGSGGGYVCGFHDLALSEHGND